METGSESLNVRCVSDGSLTSFLLVKIAVAVPAPAPTGPPIKAPAPPLASAPMSTPVPAPPPIISKFRFLWFLRSEEHTSELQSHSDLVCRLLLEKKKKK